MGSKPIEQQIAELPEGQRDQATKLLARYQRLHEANPLLRYNHPGSPRHHPKQLEFHAARTKIKALIGGNRSGKSSGGIVDDLIQCVELDALPPHLQPYKKWPGPTFGRIVAPKFNENLEGVIFPELRKWVPKDQLKGGSWERAFSKQRRVLSFKDGSWIQFLTFEQDLDAHAGAALHFCHFDEEPEGDKGLAMFNENMARLVDFDGDFKLTMTPLFGLSWSFDRIWERRTDKNVTIVQVDSFDNPHVNHQALGDFFAMLTKEERQARKEGRFVHFSGLFYDEFSQQHVRDSVPPAHVKAQNIIVGIDPGLNRTGVVWVAFDNDNAALAFAELYPENEVPADVATQIKAVNRLWDIDPDYYVIDPSARNRATVNAEQVMAEYTRAGIHTMPGQNDRAAGILEVKRRLQQGALLVTDNCKNLVWEFGRYRKDPNSSDEFASIKVDDHLLDALRYVCMSRPWHLSPLADKEAETWRLGSAPSADWLANQPDTSSPPLGGMT